MSPPTLLFAGGGTGGHVYPLLAVADALRELAPEVRAVFVGTARGLEAKLVPERGYPLELAHVLPLRGGGVVGAVRGALRAAAAVVEAGALVRRLRPRAVLSIGGYAAGPVSLAARVRGIPLALVEPNAVVGLANRLIAPLVSRAYLAFPEPERHFAAQRVVRAGVPIRAGFEPAPWEPGRRLRLLVLGGSQGAQALNESMPEAIARATTTPVVVHQAGAGRDAAVAERYRALGLQDSVRVVAYLEDMPRALAEADLVIARSGAGACAELQAVGRPSVLVPFPFAAGDHQRLNARSLERLGASVCVEARQATPPRLAALLDELSADRARLESMSAAARRGGRPHAARAIARDLLGLAGLSGLATAEGAASAPSGAESRGRLAEVR
ncbi:MAG: undecaprenyldiphospho-muramoylpentapeptide beta-N-acetylglucosaminyltransferase [Polyangiaceae bacterium]|nr:undecaprenyldiphospho-muramoylpentapeptide beta-N-acetylglucosaminyltransferase [Polyangiaceae bacterium]